MCAFLCKLIAMTKLKWIVVFAVLLLIALIAFGYQSEKPEIIYDNFDSPTASHKGAIPYGTGSQK